MEIREIALDDLVLDPNLYLRDRLDDFTVEITLLHPDGQFPQQVGAYNPQSVITPKDFVLGTTLNQKKTGTGAFKLTKYDAATETITAPEGWEGRLVRYEVAPIRKKDGAAIGWC